MPIFKFACKTCGYEEEKLVRRSGDATVYAYCAVCDGAPIMERQIPTTTSSITYETKDAHRGVQHRKNQKEMLTRRMRNHHDKYEIEEKIDRFGLDEAKKHGWLKKRKM